MRFCKGLVFLTLLLAIFHDSIAQSGEVQEWIFPTAVDRFSKASAFDAFDTLLLETVYVVMNLGPEIGPDQVLFDACQNNGHCFFGWSGAPRHLSANAMFSGPRPQSTIPPEHEGWTRLQVPSSAKVAARAEIVTYLSVGPLRARVATVTVQAVKPARIFRATLANVQPRGFSMPNSRLSAYAVVNPSRSAAARVDLEAFDRLGNQVCATSLNLPPLNRFAKLATELFAPCTPPVEGVVRFSSDIPIAVNAMDLGSPTSPFSTFGQLISVPVSAEDAP